MGERSADGFVGVFDSGVGGISVLRALVRKLPHEDFRYFGDSAHAPYGEKSEDEVLDLSRAIVGRLCDEGAKAIVVACNTATSVAAPILRREHPGLPIVGIEPALKPATEATDHGRILVMATPVTLRLDKYHELAQTYGAHSEVVSVPCPGLASRIECGNLDAPDLARLIEGLVGRYADSARSVVLGCTHYPFVRAQIDRALGGGVSFFDGGAGTARRLRCRLEETELVSGRVRPGRIELASSEDTPAQLALYREFLTLPL